MREKLSDSRTYYVRRPTHREEVYDPQHSSRAFKHFMRETTSGHQVKQAYDMGALSVFEPVRGRWASNPFRPGTRRHRAYEDGIESAVLDREEVRTYRRWNRD